MRADPEHREADQLLTEFIAGILGRAVDVGRLLTVDERAMLFRHLSRQDELKKQRRPGERLVWTVEDLDVTERERLPIPHLDAFVTALESRLPATTVPLRPHWPEGRTFAVCLSHDMDHVTAFTGREQWRELRRRSHQGALGLRKCLALAKQACKNSLRGWVKRDLLGRPDRFGNVGAWLKLEIDCGFKSSLFFFGETIEPWHPYDCNYRFGDRVQFEGRTATVGGMMREIASRGWDVGLHGSVASATEPGVLVRQKREVESVIGQPLLTTRQHCLQYDPARTPPIQAAASFLADGTQGFNDRVGFRAGTSFPYRVWDWSANRLLRLWEVPLHIQDGPLLRTCSIADDAVSVCAGFMDRVQSVGGCLGLLFHPFSLATDVGLNVYSQVIQEARRRGAWGCSMRQAAEWWQQRTCAVLNGAPHSLPACMH